MILDFQSVHAVLSALDLARRQGMRDLALALFVAVGVGGKAVQLDDLRPNLNLAALDRDHVSAVHCVSSQAAIRPTTIPGGVPNVGGHSEASSTPNRPEVPAPT